MGIFGNFPTTSSLPKTENLIWHSYNYNNIFLFRFSIFRHISFIHLDTEIFVTLSCIYTPFEHSGGGECLSPLNNGDFGSVNQVSLRTD